MSKFNTSLLINQITDVVFELTAPLVYESDILKCIITVPVGFQSDGASVPRVPIAYILFGGRAHHESVLHDYLFCKDSKPVVPFMQANRVFLEAMKCRNKNWYIRWPMFSGVVIGGHPYYHKRYVLDHL